MKSGLSVTGWVLAVVFGILWIAGAPGLDATADASGAADASGVAATSFCSSIQSAKSWANLTCFLM